MLKNVVAVGNDLRFDQSVASPTVLIAEMTVSGSGAGALSRSERRDSRHRASHCRVGAVGVPEPRQHQAVPRRSRRSAAADPREALGTSIGALIGWCAMPSSVAFERETLEGLAAVTQPSSPRRQP